MNKNLMQSASSGNSEPGANDRILYSQARQNRSMHKPRAPAHEPDYAHLREILERETGKPVSLERAQRIGAFLLRLTVLFNELQ